jgi:ubiquinone biosynthesis monooxygenase Coq7
VNWRPAGLIPGPIFTVMAGIITLMKERQLSPLDRFLSGLDNALRNAAPSPTRASRPNPAADIADNDLSDKEKKHAAALMRVNHAGEIAAQGLYQGHAALARDAHIELQMKQAAEEELDHLGWCEERLDELGERPSQLRPVWYAGAFTIGVVSGVLGDKWSLGFIEETEKQVAEHLTGHLQRLPEDDAKSRAIVAQMRDEEEQHGANANKAGAAPLPLPARQLMRTCAKIMTRTAYWF